MTVQKLHPSDLDLIVYDFDGVMTDNRVWVAQDGTEMVACHRGDGWGVGMIKELGVQQVILSTEKNAVVRYRAEKLKLEALHGLEDKHIALSEFCSIRGYQLSRVLYVGNDINDLSAMSVVGYPVSPADGHPAVRKIACLVTNACGGMGVVRELADILSSTMTSTTKKTRVDSTMDELEKRLSGQIKDAIRLREWLLQDKETTQMLCSISHEIVDCLRSGGKVLFAGNGGSFADSQHLAAEFVGRFMIERAPLAAICLGTNSSSVSAIGNDYRFDDVFVRELRALGKKGDLFIPISTSGNSRNLIEAIKVAEEVGIGVFALLGKSGGTIGKTVRSLVVPSDHTARIQEMHITVGHMICDLVDTLITV